MEDSGFYIGYGRDTRLGFVHAQTLEVDEERVCVNTFQSDSHLFNWIRDVEAPGFDLAL